jgi:uncharacterized protein YlxW (UPF0749 family)
VSERPAPPPGPLSAQLLVDLVANPLDAGYAAAAAARGGHRAPRARWFDHAAVAVGSLLIGFVLVVAYVHTSRGAPEAAKVHSALVGRVQAAQADGDRLQAQEQSLAAQANAIRDEALAGGALAGQVDRSQVLAGLTAVHGPGVEVDLDEPPAATPSTAAGRGGTSGIERGNILTDRDVRSIVNELWADGAEAIAVNGVRLTPTSAIRFAGDAVLVDLQPVTPPYQIKAIGNADQLDTRFASSDVASRYQTLVSADGISFSFAGHSSLTLPAGAPAQTRYAQPATPQSSGSR